MLNLRGFQTVATLSSAVVLPSIPPGTTYTRVQALAQNVRWRNDGIAPTASIGHQLLAGALLEINWTHPRSFQFIEETSAANLVISYYGVTREEFGVGAPSLAPMTCNGAGQAGVDGSGAPSLAPMAPAGTGTVV